MGIPDRVCCGMLLLLNVIDESQLLMCICHDNNYLLRCSRLEFMRRSGAQSLHSTIVQDLEMMESDV